MRRLRTLFQVVVVVAVLVTGLRFAMGWSRTSIETYCPFGGLESALSLFTQQTFTCATGERNLALFVALLLLTLIARKSFCAWVCPVGALSEWFAALGRKLFPPPQAGRGAAPLHALEPPRRWDRALRWLRLPVLAAVLYFTYRTGELVFRGYDPYYILFSFNGHDVKTWSYVILGVILVGVVLVSRWPGAATFARWASRSGRSRSWDGCGWRERRAPAPAAVPATGFALRRSSSAGRPRSAPASARSASSAPRSAPRAMPWSSSWGVGSMSVPRWIVPVLVVLLALAGLGAARLFAIPSVELEFPAAGGEAGAPTREVTFWSTA